MATKPSTKRAAIPSAKASWPTDGGPIRVSAKGMTASGGYSWGSDGWERCPQKARASVRYSETSACRQSPGSQTLIRAPTR
jgi:hypothetical protein